MTVTPKLGLTMMAANMAQKEVVFNEFIVAFDALFAGSAISFALTAPPGSPALGDTYVINAASPTGTWSGQAYKIAFYYNGWQFFTAPLQIEIYDVASSSFYRYTASNTWTPVSGGTPTVLADLTDVSGTSGASNGQVLTYNSTAGKWEPASPTFVSTLATLTDVNVTEGSGINGYYLTWSNGTSKWIATALPAIPTSFLGSGFTDLSLVGVANGDVLAYTSTGPGVHFVTQASLSTTAVVTSLSDVGDVTYSGLMVDDSLIWNGAAWAPSSVAAAYSFAGMTDGPGSFTGHADEFLVVNGAETALAYESLSTLLSGVTIDLQHLNDVPGSIGTAGQVLAVNTGATGFVYVTPSAGGSALTVANAGSNVDTAATTLNFINATSITTTSHDVSITLPIIQYKASGTNVTTQPTSINFTGSGVLITESGAAMTVTISGVTALASLSDVTVASLGDGDLLQYNSGASKWENTHLATFLGTIGATTGATYEYGDFAPPTAAMFPTSFQATSIVTSAVSGRGLVVQPASYGSGSYAVVRHRALSANTAPFAITCRVSPNSYESAGHGAGICLLRSANNNMFYLCVGNDGVSGESFTVRFGYFTASGVTETVLNTANVEALWLQLSFDGTYVRARISSDGLMWNYLGTAQNATSLIGGIPNHVGLFQRLVAATAGDAGGLYTYYDDPDYPFSTRVMNGVISMPITSLTDVNVTEGSPIDGQVLYWNNTAGAWESKAVTGPTFAGITTESISYTLVLADAGKLIVFNGSGALNCTIPADSTVVFPNGTVIEVEQYGTGLITILGAIGCSFGSLNNQTTTVGEYSSVRLIKNSADNWSAIFSDGGTGTLAGDSDVSLSTPAANNLLVYGGSTWGNETLTALLDAVFGNAQGDLLYRGSSTWGVLAPGTSGDFLKTSGASANPSWAAISTTLAALTDVTITSPSNGQVLTYNSGASKWENGAPGAGSLATLSDVSVAEGSGIDKNVLFWNNGASFWEARGFTLQNLSDVNIVESSLLNSHVLYWNNSDLAWEGMLLGTVAYTGAYSDLTGKPSLAAIATSGAYSDLSGTPTIYTTLATLTDVSITTGSGVDGYVVYWNNGAGKFELKSPSGGSTTLAGDSDVALTSPADGDVLTYVAASSNWENKPASGGGSALTISNNGTSVDTAATTINFVNATSITTASHDVTVTLPTGGGGGSTFGQAWTDVTFTGSTITIFGAAGTYPSDQTFTLAAGNTLEIESFIHKASSANGLIGVSLDGGTTGYIFFVGNDGNYAINYYASGSYQNIVSTGGHSQQNKTGVVKMNPTISAIASSTNGVTCTWTGLYQTMFGDSNVNMVGTVTIYLVTDNISDCLMQARVY